jgi:hypothetical protein
MASLPVRDPVGDQLLTPQNAALLVIDYQPSQFEGVNSIDRDLLLENIVSTVKAARAFRHADRPLDHQRRDGTREADGAGARGIARGLPADRQDVDQCVGGR